MQLNSYLALFASAHVVLVTIGNRPFSIQIPLRCPTNLFLRWSLQGQNSNPVTWPVRAVWVLWAWALVVSIDEQLLPGPYQLSVPSNFLLEKLFQQFENVPKENLRKEHFTYLVVFFRIKHGDAFFSGQNRRILRSRILFVIVRCVLDVSLNGIFMKPLKITSVCSGTIWTTFMFNKGSFCGLMSIFKEKTMYGTRPRNTRLDSQPLARLRGRVIFQDFTVDLLEPH